MCFLGLGEVIGSLLNGWLEDRWGPKQLVIVNLVEMFLALITIMTFT
jgi:predicted MFS family arabinose efflux permease